MKELLMSTINLSNILAELRSPAEMTKTAAECDAAKKADKKADKKEDQKEDKKEDKKEEMKKEAGAYPAQGLNKLAKDLAAVEHQTMIKEAQVFGSTMADAFASRLGEIQHVLDQSAPAEEFNKTAEEVAFDNQMEKVATELYQNMGQEEATVITDMVKTAADNGVQLSPEEAFSAIADEAIKLGEQTALEKVAAAEEIENLPAEDKNFIGHFTKEANDKGFKVSPVDVYQHFSKIAAARGAAYAEIENLSTADKSQLQGFLKTAQAKGAKIDVIDAYQYLAQSAMEKGAAASKRETEALVKTAAEQKSEFEAMEKLAADMESKGDKEGLAKLEKYAYDKGFEETLVKVSAYTSGVAYTQTNELLKHI